MINIATDTFIEIGSQHQMCEDYVISGDKYIILSDGCSSSDHSEMGARFLCYMAKQFMKNYRMNPDEETFAYKFGAWVIHNAEMLTRQMGLKKQCLDATLLVSYVKEGNVYIHMFGDGFIVTQFDGSYEILSVDYKAGSKSMPFYLRYEIDQDGRELYHKAKVTKHLFKTEIDEYGSISKIKPIEVAYDYPSTYVLPIAEYDSISICSDGLGSFLMPVADETGNKIMKPEDIVPSIFDFNNSVGVFLQRQINICKRKLKKQDLKFEHFDDLSIGTFLMEEISDAVDNQAE